MASPTPLLFFLLLTLLHTAVKSQPAAAPTASPLNLTGILDKNGQYTTLIRLLSITHIDNQIENQLNSSNEGLTLLAPTDNAFNNLKPGTLNGLSEQQQVALILYHVLPKFYKLSDFDTISNPARTQASGNDGGLYTLNFTSMTNQVNVSTGIVETPINNAIYSTFPLGIFQVDKVLLPLDLFGAKPPSTSPPPTVSTKSPPSTPAKGPSSSTSSSPSQQDSSGAVSRVGGKIITVGAIAGLFMGALL